MSLPIIVKDIEDRFKISGGTLTGNIEINQSSYPMIMIKDLGQGRRGEFIYNINEEVIISNYKDENNRSLLFLRNENNVNNSLQLSRVVDGQWSNYNIYGEHNKPAAADIGALPLTGGTLTGTVYGQWFYGTRFFGIDANGYSTMSIGPHSNGTTSVVGEGVIEIGNNVAHGNNGNSRGRLRLFHVGTSYTDLMADNSAAGNLIYLPTSSGTLALTSNLNNYLPLTGGILDGKLIIRNEPDFLRSVVGNYGIIFRNDGSDTYILLTNSGDQYGTWNSLRPFSINNSTGRVQINNGLAVNNYLSSYADLSLNKGVPGVYFNIPDTVARASIYKNTSSTADYGLYVLDESTDGKGIAFRLSSSEQTIQILKKSSSTASYAFYNILDSGNFTSYALPANASFNNNAAKCIFKSSNATLNASGSVTDLEIQSAENRKAACITFHIPNQYALHFGIDENTSRLSVGGWSMGAASYDIYTRHYPQVSVTSGAPAAGVGNERIWAW